MGTVIHFTDSRAFGGTEQSLLHLLEESDRARWQPLLWHHDEPGLGPLLKKAEALRVPHRAVPRIDTARQFGRMALLIREIQKQTPAVFHAHLTWPLSCKYGLAAAVLARVPAVVATVQLYVEPPKNALLRAQLRFIGAGVDRYLAVSQGVGRKTCRLFGLSPRKIEVVHNGVSLTPFAHPDPGLLRRELPFESERPIVLTTARLERQKGLGHLIEAAARLPEALFVLVGEGSEREALQAQAKKLCVDDRMVFMGYRDDTRALLAGCDVFVLPSLYEGLPLSILEAMAARKPVVATAISGNDEAVVEGETGLLVPPGDSEALANAIRAVLSNPPLARQLALSGRVRVEHEFSAAIMTRKVTQIYDELASGSSRGNGFLPRAPQSPNNESC